jgi:hypothetical protein
MEAGGLKWCWDFNPQACAVSPFSSWRDPAGNGVFAVQYGITLPSDSWQWYEVISTSAGCYQGQWWNGYAWVGLNDPGETCFGAFDVVAVGAESNDSGQSSGMPVATGQVNASGHQMWSTDTGSWSQWCWQTTYINMPNSFIYPNPCYLNYTWSFSGW